MVSIIAPAPHGGKRAPGLMVGIWNWDRADPCVPFFTVHVYIWSHLIYSLGTARDDQYATLRVVWTRSLTLERLKTMPMLWEQSWVQESDTVRSRAGYQGYHCQGRKGQPLLTHERLLEMPKDSWMQRDHSEFLKRTHGSSCKMDDLD